MKKKINLKDFLSDDCLDLSMNDLQEVPVKEIAAIPKATTLDLSSNSLLSLPPSFAPSLTHIVKLDLAQNQLTSLPDNFGLLVNLKHLDLFKNKLTTVPLSFGDLKSLKWLDLKENPLLFKVLQVVGPCTNSQECQNAAYNVVKFMADINKRVEKEKQRRIEEKMKRELAQQELQEKKENKQKKKKKNKVHAENGKTVIEADVLQYDADDLHITITKSSKKPPNMMWKMLKAVYKLICYVVLFSLLAIFVISLVDEPMYKQLKVKVSYITKTTSSYLPKSVVAGFDTGLRYASKLVKLVVTQLLTLLQRAVVMATDCYTWLSTDETVQLYLDSLKHFCHVAYIKINDMAGIAYSETIAFINRITN